MTLIAGFVLVELDNAFPLGYPSYKLSLVLVVLILYFSAPHFSVDPGSLARIPVDIVDVGSLPMCLSVIETAHIHASLREQPSLPVGQVVCSLLSVLPVVDETRLHDGELVGLDELGVVSFGVYTPVVS